MRTPVWMLHFLMLAVIHLAISAQAGNVEQPVKRSVVDGKRLPAGLPPFPLPASPPSWRFPTDDNALPNTRQSKNQFVGFNSGALVPVPGTRGMPPPPPPSAEGPKKGRKATPDVQDIISGIVHLLGGKVNLHAASGTSPDGLAAGNAAAANRPQAPHSTRINNRAPPRLTEVPFEAIPLELGNSGGGGSQQQLPFGVPYRPPVFPPKLPQPGHNVQELPFGGVQLPVQLVPPLSSPNRPWSFPTSATSIVNTTGTTTTSVPVPDKVVPMPSAITPIVSKNTIPPAHSRPDSTMINFFPEDHAVRHPPAAVVVATTTTASPSLPETIASSSVPIYETSSLDSILQPSIEDTTPSSSQTPVEAVTTSSFTIPGVVVSSSSIVQGWQVPSAVPQLEAGVAPTTYMPSVGGYTPPLPSARPGQVFSDEYLSQPNHYGEGDVITKDDIQPQSNYGDTFELVVTAAQNFGGNPPPPDVTNGRPYVIPVSIDQVRGGMQPASPVDSDEFVSIDGRKTYFNLYPTDVADAPSQTLVPVLPTPVPNIAPVNNNGYGFALQATPILPPSRPAPTRPSYPKPVVPVVSRPTPALVRRPSTTPLSRIDACIVGDPNACLEPNETCQVEDDGSACNCKPGFGRKKAIDVCKALSGMLVSIRLDRMDNQRITWTSKLADTSSPDYQQLEWEANKAINTMMEMTPLSSHYVFSTVNKFYAIGNKIIVNASVFMEQSPETQSVTVRPTLQKQLSTLIQQRNNNLGISRLWVDGQTNPITAVLDLNECSESELNDCSADAECINTPGSFSCQCKAGFSDPYPNDPYQAGRQCNSCTRSHCNNRGECRIEDGNKKCYCQGNYKGQQCELDGEVLGVAVGASVAAVIIIILTLVLLCMWSRRWRQNQEKMSSGYMEQLKTMPFPAIMQDRIRWAAYAEAMASAHNLYAQPMHPPFFYQPPSTIGHSSPAPSVIHSTLSPPPVPPRNKPPVRQASSLPVSLVTSTAHQVLNNIQELARKISRKKRASPRQPDPVNVNPHLALISPGYPVGTMSTISRSSLAPTMPLVGQFHRTRSTCGSVHSYGKRPAPPPPVNPPPALQVMETSEESAAESDVPIARPFHVPRPRSRASALSSNNIYHEADAPATSNDFSNQSQLSVNTYHQAQRQGQRFYYR